MRKKVFALLLAAAPLIAFADVEISKEEASSIKPYDLSKVKNAESELMGRIVKLKFHTRYGSINNYANGSITGELRLFGTRGTDATLNVYVPPEGAAWFMKLPSDDKRSTEVVYARIVSGEVTSVAAKLLGRQIKTDAKGSRIVW